MNTDNTTHSPDTGWQIFGELELPAGAGTEDPVYTWLTQILLPLHLQAELLDKIIESAQDAVARAAHSGIVEKFEHLHLMVLVPARLKEKKRAWGFFRLEKFENAEAPQTTGEHTVEFYLYGEGE